MSTEASRELCSVIAENLKTLIRENGLTQKRLAEQIGVAPATMNDYCSGKRVPQATFLVALRKLYGIDINDFLTSDIYTPGSSMEDQGDAVSEALKDVYEKYCGCYYVYYMDTSKFKGRDTLSPAMSLLYGILYIYKEPSSLGGTRYRCASVLGFRSVGEAKNLMAAISPGSVQPGEVLKKIGSGYADKAYYGSFELSQEHAFINLRHAGMDRALAVLHRIDNNKTSYAGGIATINSISKGRERMPVIQFFGMSRQNIEMSAEEIQHALLLNYPNVSVEDETDEILRVFRTLYLNHEDSHGSFSQEQKRAVIRSTLERAVRKNLERNAFRYAKISEGDDDDWYHMIKNSAEGKKDARS